MKITSIKELKKIIFYFINPAIDKHRELKNDQFFFEFPLAATENEIDEFIESIPYFDKDLKKFLLLELPINVENMMISQEWEIEFTDHVYLWSYSLEWLNGIEILKSPDIGVKQLGIFKIKI